MLYSNQPLVDGHLRHLLLPWYDEDASCRIPTGRTSDDGDDDDDEICMWYMHAWSTVLGKDDVQNSLLLLFEQLTVSIVTIRF